MSFINSPRTIPKRQSNKINLSWQTNWAFFRLILLLADKFEDVYENQNLTVEQLRQLTWEEMKSFEPPALEEVGDFWASLI